MSTSPEAERTSIGDACTQSWHLPIRRPSAASDSLVPWWMPPLFLLFAAGLALWIVWLFVSLPSREIANHWEIAWSGFDVMLALSLGATGLSLVRRSPLGEVAASMTGALLIADAWFDVMTSRGTATLVFALLEAFCIELPLAGVCLWIARNMEKVVEDARPILVRAGFRIEHHHLVGPEKGSAAAEPHVDQ